MCVFVSFFLLKKVQMAKHKNCVKKKRQNITKISYVREVYLICARYPNMFRNQNVPFLCASILLTNSHYINTCVFFVQLKFISIALIFNQPPVSTCVYQNSQASVVNKDLLGQSTLLIFHQILLNVINNFLVLNKRKFKNSCHITWCYIYSVYFRRFFFFKTYSLCY